MTSLVTHSSRPGRRSTPRYAELHAHSHYSFLDGACSPEELVSAAIELELEALALLDHDGLYGIVKFTEAAREQGIPTVIGAELSINQLQRINGIPDPSAEHLVVHARNPSGYARLSRTISQANLAGSKGLPVFSWSDFEEATQTEDWAILTGCRKGPVVQALHQGGVTAAERSLSRLIDMCGRDNVFVELWHHHDPQDDDRNEVLYALARKLKVQAIATTNAHACSPEHVRLAQQLAAIRSCSTLDEMDGWLPAAPAAHLRSGAEQQARFHYYPGVVEAAAELASELAFDLKLTAPELPLCRTEEGLSEIQYLRRSVEQMAVKYYGTRDAETYEGAWKRIDFELDTIEDLGFAGYFLIVWEIVQFCKEQNIYCQGRGSAASSAVCFVLGITVVDAVRRNLLFERFLSPAREGAPDIDIDIESGRREEVIQHVFEKYGREHCAQVSNVISYRSRSAIRDAAKIYGHDPDSFTLGGRRKGLETIREEGRIPEEVGELAQQLKRKPRHLGVHPGGLIMCDRPVIEVCPVEWATAENRSVLQWDKDDCAEAGLVKFDLLGLGMLEALHRSVDSIHEHYGVEVDLSLLPQEDEVYDRLCTADTVGVFQVESRAQMSTLPRMQPRSFKDLVVEIALIRPGPIQGGSVHPYLRRRQEKEPSTPLHPLMAKTLEDTHGVPLFQEQIMRIAVEVGGFCAGEADQLRKAMGSKRSEEKLALLKGKLYRGMAARGVDQDTCDRLWKMIEGFSEFGFPESHAASFAGLVYASAWVKFHYPEVFLASILNSQPVGFWSPATLIADARRHGVTVLKADINYSEVGASLEPIEEGVELWEADADAASFGRSSPPRHVVRLGLARIKKIGAKSATKIVENAPYKSIADLANRAALSEAQLEKLATAGALASLDQGERRQSLWEAGPAARWRTNSHDKTGTNNKKYAQGMETIPGLEISVPEVDLVSMTKSEVLLHDLYTTNLSADASAADLLRPALAGRQVVAANQLMLVPDGSRVQVAGIITHRQRPGSGKGVTFVSLEDPTGLINVVCSPGLVVRYDEVFDAAAALLVSGKVENKEGVVNIVARKLEQLIVSVAPPSRNYC